MKNWKFYLNDLKQIEKIILKCYGKHGKSALIQCTDQIDSSSTTMGSYMLTNDGITLLNSLKLPTNPLYKLIYDSVKKFSNLNGDNSKCFFVYFINILTGIVDPEQNSQSEYDSLQTSLLLRSTSITYFMELITNKWNENYPSEKITTLNKAQFIDKLQKLRVLYDMENFNKILSNTSAEFIVKIIEYYINNSEKSVQDTLKTILDDLEYMYVYSDRFTIDKSRLFTNGFLLENRFTISQPNLCNKKSIRAIILVKQPQSDINSGSVEITSNLSDKLFTSIFSSKLSHFPIDFINELKANNIDLIFMSGSLTELQKSQLNSIGCSLISFIDYNLLNFISFKLNVKTLDFIELKMDPLNIFEIESIENVQDDKVYHFRTKNSSPAFIYFCSPVKLMFNHFKNHVHKVLKTVLNNINDNSLRISECNDFETKLFDLLDKLSLSASNEPYRPIFRCLSRIFRKIDIKLNGNKLRSISKPGLINEKLYWEPLDLKFNCLSQVLYSVQGVTRVDLVINLKAGSNFDLKKTDSSSDSD